MTLNVLSNSKSFISA